MSKCTKRCKIVQVCSIELSEYPRGDREKVATVFSSVDFGRENLTFFSLIHFDARWSLQFPAKSFGMIVIFEV